MKGVRPVRTLLAREIIDPATDLHYRRILSLKAVTEMHRHDFSELFLITRGSIWHLVNGRRQRLKTGALVLVRPHDEHCYQQYGQEDCEFVNLAFAESTREAVCRFLGVDFPWESMQNAELPPAAVLTQAELESLLPRLDQLGETQGPAARVLLRALLAELFVRYFQGQGAVRESAMPAWLESLLEAMREPEQVAAGLPRLYALSPCTAEHLSRTFRKHLGRTPTEWINEARLKHAATLLMQTDEPIVAVALRCGFENLSHFYHLFQKRHHVSPARYRRQHHKPVVPQ